jgi:hypothetical protein
MERGGKEERAVLNKEGVTHVIENSGRQRSLVPQRIKKTRVPKIHVGQGDRQQELVFFWEEGEVRFDDEAVFDEVLVLAPSSSLEFGGQSCLKL